MRRAANHRVYVRLFDVKVDIEAVKNIKRHVSQQAVDHLDVATASVDILGCLLADLHSRRVERSILVLVRADQHHVLEPAEAFGLREPVQIAVFEVALVGHAQLPDRGALLPLVHEPKTGGEQLARLVHVAKMR